MSRLNREEQKDQARPKRVPVHEANRNKLFVKGLDHENYQYRWVNDREDRLAKFLEGGYEFVENRGQATSDGGVDESVGTSSRLTKGVGGGVVSYLMRIPRELYDQDQAAKQRDIDQMEADIKGAAKEQFRGKLEITSKKSNDPFA